MPGIDINKKSPPLSIIPEDGATSTNNNAISISPTKRAIMNAFANSLSRSLSMGSFSYKSLGKSLSQMSYGRSPLFDIYQQFKQSVPKNSLPPLEEDDEMAQDIEANFCKDFTCCGMVLKDLHELLQHFEDAHRMESDMEEDDDLPFEFDDLSSNRNTNNNIPTLTDLFLKDLESKQRHIEESNLLNNMGIQNQPIQQSIAMSDIYSEDKKLVNPATTIAGNNISNPSFSNILNNKVTARSNSTSNLNSSLNHLTPNLTRTNSASSLGSKLNSSISKLNIPNNTISSTSKISTPTSATSSNFNLSKNISAFNNAVSSTSSSTSSIFNTSGSSSQPQTPNLGHTTLSTTASTSTAATTTTASAALAASSGLQALNNLKNIQKLPSTKSTSSIQAAPVTTAALPTGMHSLFPNAIVNPFNLLGKGSTSSFNMMNTTNQPMSEEPQDMDDMDMDMDDASEMMNMADPLLMAEAGPDEDKKYRCTVPGCNKSYKNPGGLKYHLQHGHFENTGDPEMDKIMHKPFQCTFENCGKRYKNMNGLKYHIEHSHSSFIYNQQQGNVNLANSSNSNQNHTTVSLDSQQVLAFQALQMQQQLQQQLQHIN